MNIEPIGVVKSPFLQKFGTPRQAALAPEAKGILELNPEVIEHEALKGIDSFTHLWVITYFHRARSMKGLIRPPRLGGNKKIGVLATRSPNHPNPIGLSLVKLEHKEGYHLHVSEMDIVDGTPILDIKPYLKLWDSRPEANLGWVDKFPQKTLKVLFSRKIEGHLDPSLSPELIEQVLSQDPRPAYKPDDDSQIYGLTLSGHEIKFKISNGTALVLEIRNLNRF